jgi:hypothetical protein
VPDLEQRLTDLGGAIAWPPTPKLDVAQLLPIHGEVARGARRWGWPVLNTRWAMAAAAVLLILATLLAYTPSREAIAAWINLHVRITQVQQLQTPSPLPSGTLGDQLGLGLPTTLEQAQRQVRFKITVPSTLGQPDAVYLRSLPEGGEVTLVYGHVAGIPVAGETGVAVLVTEVQGQVRRDFFDKMVGPNTTIEDVVVNGHAGIWVSGSPHNFVFLDAAGQPVSDTLRLATNTLIFSDGGTITRIEAYTSKERAIEIASSLQAR